MDWTLNSWLLALSMFSAAFVLDILWAFYIRRVGERKKVSAASLSVMIGACSTLWVVGVEKDLVFSLFWLAGLFGGTYTGLVLEERREARKVAKEASSNT